MPNFLQIKGYDFLMKLISQKVKGLNVLICNLFCCIDLCFQPTQKNFGRKHAPGRWRGQIQISDTIGRSG